MKLGLYGSTGEGATPRGAIAIAEAAETAGFESIWGPEHVVVPSGYQTAYPYATSGKMAGGAEEFDLPDPLIWLAYVAARTTRLKLCTGILILPQRNARLMPSRERQKVSRPSASTESSCQPARRTLSSFRVRSSHQDSVDFVGHPLGRQEAHSADPHWARRNVLTGVPAPSPMRSNVTTSPPRSGRVQIM